jgi:hypothetical protein
VALYDLHDIIYRAKGVGGVIEVSGEAVGVVAVSVGISVFSVSLREFSTGLSNIGLAAVRTGDFVYS